MLEIDINENKSFNFQLKHYIYCITTKHISYKLMGGENEKTYLDNLSGNDTDTVFGNCICT